MSDLQNALSKSQNKSNSPANTVKALMKSKTLEQRFNDVLGEKAPQFMSSIINLVNSNQSLQKVDAMSVISSAMVAATLDLPVDPNLGYMWIVPYKGRATPQMGYKGYIQLALRTGQYKAIEAGAVYEGEMRNFDRFTGHYERGEKISDEVVGYFGHFELLNGFEKTVYWSRDEIDAHRRKFSKMSGGPKPSGVWADNFDAMATKTVLRNMLSKWGILSIQMQNAVTKDETPQNFDPETGEIMSDPKWVDGVESAPEDEASTGEPSSAPQDPTKEAIDAAADFFKAQDKAE